MQIGRKNRTPKGKVSCSESPWWREDTTHTWDGPVQVCFPIPNFSPSPQAASCWTPQCFSRPHPHLSARGGNSHSCSGSVRQLWPPKHTEGEKLHKKAVFCANIRAHESEMSSDSMQSWKRLGSFPPASTWHCLLLSHLFWAFHWASHPVLAKVTQYSDTVQPTWSPKPG